LRTRVAARLVKVAVAARAVILSAAKDPIQHSAVEAVGVRRLPRDDWRECLLVEILRRCAPQDDGAPGNRLA